MAVLASLLLLSHAVLGATFTVTTTSNGGAGSFRQAILGANATSGTDTIEFQIPGAGPFTISLLSTLPVLTETVAINATTQPTYTDHPVVELNGAGAGGSTVGLRLVGGGSTIRGLAINRFGADGIRLDSSGNIIQGNHIGTDFTGLIARGNGQIGVFVLGTSSNLIGGTNAADRNVISGGNDTGIYILNGAANVVQGNYIGVNAAGLLDLGNRNNGVTIFNGSGNTIGGVAPEARNVIAGNDGSGINLNGAGATGNVIQGNYIGVAVSALLAVGNLADGITLNGAPGNLIGGTNSGARNLISGNGQAGVFLNGPDSAANRIEGNYIGTDAVGSAALGNAYAGVTLLGAVSNRIGGTVVEARNVISGNRQDGVFATENSLGNRIQGNFIGVTASGAGRLGNAFQGVALNGAAFNLIGGTATGAGNVISGNTNIGVWFFGVSASNNIVQGNMIGTDATGNAAIGNSGSGMQVESPANLIGGGAAGAGNVISGNGYIGVWLLNSNAVNNFVRGNLIGTAVGGTNGLGNAFVGIGLSDAASNQIGGLTVAERNLISANGLPGNNGGIFVLGDKAKGNRFYGNFIGTDITGQTALANRYEGIYISGASSNIIGSELAGGGNLISGNTTRGLFFMNSSYGNLIRGNLIGTKLDGVSPLGNGQHNVEFEAGCHNNSVGGTVPGAGNRIAYTGTYNGGPFAGVRVRNLATNNLILGNAIFSNSALGISFSGLAVTANDAASCDSDSGANMLQNFPVITEVYSGAYTTVRGTLNSRANTLFRIQFFSSTSCDASGNGEGQVYLGDMLVITDGACSNSFMAILPVAVAPGNVITATATDPANNTSEFSACSTVQAFPPSPRLAINLASNQVSFTWTNTATCFVLRATDSLSAPIQWATVMNAPVVTNGQFLVTLPRQSGDHFYLLYSPCAALPPSPLLEINSIASNQISLAWTITATGFVLKETASLSAPIQWATVTNAPAITNGQFLVTLPRQSGNRFYRLSFE